MFDKKRVDFLIKRINGRKSEDNTAATYKDSKDLKELIVLLSDYENEELTNLMEIHRGFEFVSLSYESMGRFSVGAIYRLETLKIAKHIFVRFGLKTDTRIENLNYVLRDRNYYIDDDCLDVKELVKDLIDDSQIEKSFNYIYSRRRSLKHDPIEMSQEYLDVIDEVEEKIEKNRTIYGMGACHEIWHLKFIYLMEKGIEWHSPVMLNPRVRFD